MRSFKIGNRLVGEGAPCYIIAEVSCNHNGDFNEARRIIEAAAAAGADSVKLQTYTADTITGNFKGKLEGTMWAGMDLHALYAKAHTPWEWHSELNKVAKDNGLQLFSSPFDETAVDFLVDQGVEVLKVASFEAVDTKLMEHMARTGLPIIVSNGMTDFLEMKESIDVLRGAGAKDIAALHCNSGYPAAFNEVNLATIPAIADLFDVVAGLSDHTIYFDHEDKTDPQAHVSPVESVKFGAKIIELHLMMDRAEGSALFEKDAGGYDWPFSREPAELKKMVDMIREYERTGSVDYETDHEREVAKTTHGKVSFEPTPRELQSRPARPALWVTEDIKAGQPFKFAGGKPGNFDSKRPGNGGLHIRFTDFFDGKKAVRDIEAGTPVTWDMIETGAAKA